MVRPSRRKEMAQKAVEQRGVSVRLACRMFNVSESCYRYQAKLRAEDDVIADWLVPLTTAHRNWGFDLCFLYLRNVKGFKWNHKRVYRVYRQAGAEPASSHANALLGRRQSRWRSPPGPTSVWSMDFMHDQLADGRSIRAITDGWLHDSSDN